MISKKYLTGIMLCITLTAFSQVDEFNYLPYIDIALESKSGASTIGDSILITTLFKGKNIIHVFEFTDDNYKIFIYYCKCNSDKLAAGSVKDDTFYFKKVFQKKGIEYLDTELEQNFPLFFNLEAFNKSKRQCLMK